ncbi:MAG TPA: phosphoadenylyl-sulfate reductase [Bryobacteraceae bacterium]|nr:phosphoadenylyl-sulfate reductase [Bryobacteraceae bacterium]
MTVAVPETETLSASEVLRWAVEKWGDHFAVVTSFQNEGMVVLDMAARLKPDVRVYTIDTGRLPPETYDAIEAVYGRYGLRVRTLHPEAAELASMVAKFGPNLFLESPGHRRACCEIRKVRPLAAGLTRDGIEAYAVGLRRQQSETRRDILKVDSSENRTKISPLADWTREQVAAYLREHDVPVHPLYAKGYGSIGCGPCTRATAEGEAERAGRWWWEQGIASECGLHFGAGGKVERTVDVLVREILSS